VQTDRERKICLKAAIVDYGLGNLYSISQACRHVGVDSVVSSSRDDLEAADVMILPGVGAFGTAMEALRRLDLVEPLRELAKSGKPTVGICLGMQLLMDESREFGRHEGLGVVSGRVVPLWENVPDGVKVPHTAWTGISPETWEGERRDWTGTPLEGLSSGAHMYFVHSYRVVPEDPEVVLSTSVYGKLRFCSSLQSANVFGAQYHPERSGLDGLHIYKQIRLLSE
jgi:glutamine amidotransferase